MKNAAELTGSKTKADYKRDLISCTNLASRLGKCNFDLNKFWSRTPANAFKPFGNDAQKIKVYKKKK